MTPRSPVARLLTAQGFADFADWLDFAVIGVLLAYVWQVEPTVFAMLAVAMGLPYILIGPMAGAVVDQSSLRKVLVASNLGRAVATLAMAIAPGWQVLLVLIALRSSVDAFFTPAKQSAIQRLVDEPDRMLVNGRSLAINQASKIVAPALGGAALIVLAPSWVFVLNAGMSLVAMGLVRGLAAMAPVSPDPAPLVGQIRAGGRLAWDNGAIRQIMILTALGYFGMFFYDTLIAPLIRDFGHSPTLFAFSLTAVGAGGVAGAVCPVRARPFVWLALGAMISALVVAFLGGVHFTGGRIAGAPLLAGFAVLGFTTSMSVVPLRTGLQNACAPGEMGRVTALNEALSTLTLLSAPFIGAGLATVFGIGAAFLGGAVVLAIVAALAVRWR